MSDQASISSHAGQAKDSKKGGRGGTARSGSLVRSVP
jgi:hypothetical protein